jgi:hypothetical protein
VSEALNCTPSELSIFLQALAAESSLTSCSATGRSVLLKFDPTAKPSCDNGWRTESSLGSPSSPTCASSTDDRGEALWTSSTVHSPASPSPVRAADGGSPSTSGPSNAASSESASPDTSLQKTSNGSLSKEPRGTCMPTAIALPFASYPQPTWVPRTNDEDGGSWLPTPTETANFDSPSMRKQWPAHRRMHLWTGGLTTATHIEFLMGWPLGWSDSAPLEMGSFLSWKQRHGCFCGLSLITDLMESALAELTEGLKD